MKSATSIPASKLAAYAANPTKFCQHNGEAYDKSLAKKGDKAHHKAGKGGSLTSILIVMVLTIIVVYFSLVGGL